MTAPPSSVTTSTVDADLLQLVADHRGAALEVRPSLLRQQREARRAVLRVLEQAVAVAIGQPDGGEQLLRARPDRAASAAGRASTTACWPAFPGRRPARRRRRTPCRRTACDRPPSRSRGAARRAAATRRADRWPSAPGLRLNHRPSALRDDAEVEQLDAACVGRALQRRVGVRRDLARHHVELPRLEPQQLRALIRDDLDDEAIQIRQRAAVRRLAEVARVAREDEALPGHVLATARTGRARRSPTAACRAPTPSRSVPALSAPPSLCRGRIGRLSRIRTPGRERRREGDDHGVRVGRRDLQLLAAGLQRIGERAAALLVVRRLERKQHIVGGERVAVGEDDVAPELQRDAAPVVGGRPAFGEPRLDFLRRVIDANELGLGEVGDQVGAWCRAPRGG